jgi:hypothetical protein
MRKLILFVSAAALVMVMTSDASAGIFGRRRCATPTYVYTAPVATARADQGYRTYSYEPATSYRPVTPMYRSYQSPKRPPWAYQKTDPRRYQ